MSDPTRNQDKIEVGDIVRVILAYHQNAEPEYLEDVKVLYTPCAEGDSWRLKRIEGSGQLYYVQRFAIMTLLKKAE